MRHLLLFSAVINVGTVLAACSPGWYGTAPFCDGECPSNMRKTKTSNCGDGKCCATGSKVYCECIDNPGCASVWVGSAPFCSPGSCPSGWHDSGTRSDWGDGGYCVTGKKKLCDCDGGGGPACQPKPADLSCAGIFLICNNGCKKYVCGGCAGFG